MSSDCEEIEKIATQVEASLESSGMFASGPTVSDSHFEGCGLDSRLLARVNFERTRLTGCSFVGAHMAEVRLVGCAAEGVRLRKAVLAGADIISCEFTECDFIKVDLTEASIVDSVFRRCDLTKAFLSGTKLHGVKFVDCTMKHLFFKDNSIQDLVIEEPRDVVGNTVDLVPIESSVEPIAALLASLRGNSLPSR